MGFLSKLFKKEEVIDIHTIEQNALNGNIKSAVILAQDSASGIGCLKDSYTHDEVLKWNKVAAKLGDATSQYNYSLLIFKDLTIVKGVPIISEKKNLEEAIFWMNEASKQNFEDAKELLIKLKSVLNSIE